MSHSRYQYVIDVGDAKGPGAFTSDTLEGETQLKGEINYDLAPQHQMILGTSAKLVDLDHQFASRGIDVYNNETGRVIRISIWTLTNKKELTKLMVICTTLFDHYQHWILNLDFALTTMP